MITFIYKSSHGYYKENFTSLVAGIADRIEAKKHSTLVAIFDHNYGRAIYKSKDFEQYQRDLQQAYEWFSVMGAHKLQPKKMLSKGKIPSLWETFFSLP